MSRKIDSAERRPRGRPPTRDLRRRQLIDAAVRCVLRDGVDGLTRAKVAAEAGLSPASVHYFVGTMDDLIDATIDDLLESVETATQPPPDTDETERIERLFDGSISVPKINQLTDELIAHAYRHRSTRTSVRRLYRSYRRTLDEDLTTLARHADPDDIAMVRDALLAMAHAGPTLEALGQKGLGANLERAAKLLIDSLG